MIVKRGYKCKSNKLKILFCYLFIIICIRVCVHSRCKWFEHDGNHVIQSRLALSINPPLFTVTIQAKTSSNQLIHEVSPHYEPISISLDDQTQVDSKPAGQPKHASLNQCQLIAANWCSGHPQLVVEIRFLCDIIDARALIGHCSHVTSH